MFCLLSSRCVLGWAWLGWAELGWAGLGCLLVMPSGYASLRRVCRFCEAFSLLCTFLLGALVGHAVLGGRSVRQRAAESLPAGEPMLGGWCSVC